MQGDDDAVRSTRTYCERDRVVRPRASSIRLWMHIYRPARADSSPAHSTMHMHPIAPPAIYVPLTKLIKFLAKKGFDSLLPLKTEQPQPSGAMRSRPLARTARFLSSIYATN